MFGKIFDQLLHFIFKINKHKKGIMMRKTTLALSAICLLLSLNHSAMAKESAPAPLYPGVNVAQLAQQSPVHWVSVAQIENSLNGRAPVAVGFDIDDTVLFSSPGFYRGQLEFSPGKQDYLKNPQFWEKMNNGWDEFSMPKEVAKSLIAMHLKRGDSIYFVTGRSETKIFYGDSDNDITAAQAAGARGIRVLRASNSSYKPLPQAGAYGEEVVVNSEY